MQVTDILPHADAAEQLDDLLGPRNLLFQRSIIIITTRDKEILIGKVDYFYEVSGLDSEKSLQLFSYHAFGRDKPAKDFVFLSCQMVNLAGGLPLALEVFGSLLSDKRRMKDWESALQKLKKIRPGDLQDVLQISVDELEVDQKCVFLDIACFFVQMNLKREDAIDILTGCGLSAEIIITVLVARSLVKIIDDDVLWMHDQIRDTGRQIVQSENHEDPGWRSRLWDRDEILRTLKNEKGTQKIRGIVLDFQRTKLANQLSRKRIALDEFWTTFKVSSGIMYLMEAWRNFFYPGVQKVGVKLCTKSFEGMINLKLLQINYVRIEGRFEHMPAGIKWLQWKGCPTKTLPPDFCPQELAVLDLSESKIEQLWRWRWWNWWNWHCNPDVLKKLHCLSIPGSEIPGWFSKGAFHFSKRRNRKVEYIIISLVVSLNEKVSDEGIYELPIIADFEAVIFRLNKNICNTKLPLMGVPKVAEAQLYLCRFMDHQPLGFNLLDGDTIQVVKRDPGIIKGLELKECGIHVVYENDDDFVQDEDLLADSQQSVSQKLESFLHSPGGRHVSQTNQDPDLLDHRQ